MTEQTHTSHYWAYTLRKPQFKKDTCTPVLFAALFAVGRTWKRSRYPSTDEWVKNIWYIYTIEFYSAIKKE